MKTEVLSINDFDVELIDGVSASATAGQSFESDDFDADDMSELDIATGLRAEPKTPADIYRLASALRFTLERVGNTIEIEAARRLQAALAPQ